MFFKFNTKIQALFGVSHRHELTKHSWIVLVESVSCTTCPLHVRREIMYSETFHISSFVQFGQQVAVGADLAMDEAMIYSPATLPKHLYMSACVQIQVDCIQAKAYLYTSMCSLCQIVCIPAVA